MSLLVVFAKLLSNCLLSICLFFFYRVSVMGFWRFSGHRCIWKPFTFSWDSQPVAAVVRRCTESDRPKSSQDNMMNYDWIPFSLSSNNNSPSAGWMGKQFDDARSWQKIKKQQINWWKKVTWCHVSGLFAQKKSLVIWIITKLCGWQLCRADCGLRGIVGAEIEQSHFNKKHRHFNCHAKNWARIQMN